MTAARRLARFRVALAVFVFTSIPMAFIAVPTFIQVANRWWLPTSWRLSALLILIAWSGSVFVMWVTEEKRLYANRRKAGVR